MIRNRLLDVEILNFWHDRNTYFKHIYCMNHFAINLIKLINKLI